MPPKNFTKILLTLVKFPKCASVALTYGIPLPFVSGANLSTKYPEIKPPRAQITGSKNIFSFILN